MLHSQYAAFTICCIHNMLYYQYAALSICCIINRDRPPPADPRTQEQEYPSLKRVSLKRVSLKRVSLKRVGSSGGVGV